MLKIKICDTSFLYEYSKNMASTKVKLKMPIEFFEEHLIMNLNLKSSIEQFLGQFNSPSMLFLLHWPL